MCHVCDVMCVCRVCSPLCHEEVAPAQQPRWLQLRGQRLPQSQPVCGGNWGRASGTTSTPEDSQTLPQCFAFFSSSACKFDNHATTSPLPLTAHWSVVSPAYCRQRRGRQAMTRTTLRATCCCLLEWLFAGPHCHWRCTEPRTFPRVRWLTSDRPLKISSSSLEIRCGVVAAMQSKLWWNLPLTFSTSGRCICAVNKRHVWRRGEQEEPGGSFLGGSFRWQKGSQNKHNFCSHMPMHPVAKQKWPFNLVHLQLCTQIIEKNANPEWNQLLNLQVKVRTSHEQKWVKNESCYNFVF